MGKHYRKEADYAINGAKLNPCNESPWRYLVGIIREEPSLTAEYEKMAAALWQVLMDADRDPDGCANLTSARIDMLEMLGDVESLTLVHCCLCVCDCCFCGGVFAVSLTLRMLF